jgi:hypothetical protein
MAPAITDRAALPVHSVSTCGRSSAIVVPGFVRVSIGLTIPFGGDSTDR